MVLEELETSWTIQSSLDETAARFALEGSGAQAIHLETVFILSHRHHPFKQVIPLSETTFMNPVLSINFTELSSVGRRKVVHIQVQQKLVHSAECMVATGACREHSGQI